MKRSIAATLLYESAQQGGACAVALMTAVDVERRFGSRTISPALFPPVGIGISCDAAVGILRHQQRIFGGYAVEPGTHLLHCKRFGLKGDGCMRYVVIVNLCDPSGVVGWYFLMLIIAENLCLT